MSIKNRVGRLEQSARNQNHAADEAISREVLRRTTDDELRAYRDAMKRVLNGEKPAPGDEAILARILELREEVTRRWGGER